MSDFIINDTMAGIRCEIEDREIYNDIRSDTGISDTQTIIDSDPTYSRKYFHRYTGLPADEKTYRRTFYVSEGTTALSWSIGSHSAADYDYNPYYNYYIKIVSSDSSKCVIEYKNTGSTGATLEYTISYRYLTSEGSSHEETIYSTLKVRATDDTSIRKYARRVMNLTWPEGTELTQMQALVDSYCVRYAEPMPKLTMTLKGSTNELLTDIMTGEISDTVTVTCTNLGLTAEDFFINSISIRIEIDGMPVATWGLEAKRAFEGYTIFTIDTSSIDGTDYIS